MPKFLTEIQFGNTGSMDTPDPNSITIYLNTDGHLYAKFTDRSQFRLTRNKV